MKNFLDKLEKITRNAAIITVLLSTITFFISEARKVFPADKKENA